MGEIDLASVSYVLGIVSIVMAFFNPISGLIFGIIGFFQSKRLKSHQAKKMNIIGIILNIIFLAISVAFLIYSIKTGIDPTGSFPIL
jgi:hypothetical protein